jgi:hypothetical protein
MGGGGYSCEGERGEVKKERQRKRQDKERESAKERKRQEDNQRTVMAKDFLLYTILPRQKNYMQSKIKLYTMKHLRHGKNASFNLKSSPPEANSARKNSLAFYEQSVILRYSRPGARKTGLCMYSWVFIPCLLYDSTAGTQEAATVPRTIQQLEHKKLRQKLLPCLLYNPTAET